MTYVAAPKAESTQTASLRKSWILLVAGILGIVVGIGSIAGGIFGAWYTWDQAVAQDVVTPDDAPIANTPVRGPFTMWSQADIITHHQLANTDGLYYAQMPRQVQQVDDNGQGVLDANGDPVMVANEARNSWFNATVLTTALSVGIVSYALSAMAIAVGITLAFLGFVFLYIRKRAVLL